MKKIFSKIFLVGLGLTTAISCSEPENVIYDVFDGVEYGAVLRTKDRVNTNFNLFDLNSTFEIVVEQQDEQYGKLLDNVEVHMTYTDRKDDGVDNNRAETLVTTIPASSFTTSASGLPITTISVTFGEALTALGLSAGQYAGGDRITIRLELVLTDGRRFSAADASGSLQGSYFASPYQYTAGILCIPATPFAGDYVIDMQDSYGDGWNGASIRVTIDGTSQDVFIATGSVGSETVTVPAGTSTLTFEFVSGSWDSEITCQIYTPSGALGAAIGPSPPVGEIALDLCNE